MPRKNTRKGSLAKAELARLIKRHTGKRTSTNGENALLICLDDFIERLLTLANDMNSLTLHPKTIRGAEIKVAYKQLVRM